MGSKGRRRRPLPQRQHRRWRALRQWAEVEGLQPLPHVVQVEVPIDLGGQPRVAVPQDPLDRRKRHLCLQEQSGCRVVWRTFLQNHVLDLVSIDFFVVPTATFRLLYVFVVLLQHRRKIVHFNVTDCPSAACCTPLAYVGVLASGAHHSRRLSCPRSANPPPRRWARRPPPRPPSATPSSPHPARPRRRRRSGGRRSPPCARASGSP